MKIYLHYQSYKSLIIKGLKKCAMSMRGVVGVKFSFPTRTLVLALSMILITSLYADSAWADTASYYTYESCVREGTSGVWTASGERFDENDLTCAMRSRDWGGMYKVTNLANGKSVVVRHNDFGPNKKLWNKGRKIDLSKGAFQGIADLRQGIIDVKIEPMGGDLR